MNRTLTNDSDFDKCDELLMNHHSAQIAIMLIIPNVLYFQLKIVQRSITVGKLYQKTLIKLWKQTRDSDDSVVSVVSTNPQTSPPATQTVLRAQNATPHSFSDKVLNSLHSPPVL